MGVRVQKILSQWGIASRRQAEQMILAGRVRLNGTVAHLGQKADPEWDQLEVDGVAVHPNRRPDFLYILLHKPAKTVCTCEDPWGRPTVLDLLPTEWQQGLGLHPVGRLDADSTGALILTNDGELTFALTHPRHHIAKTYQVWVAGSPTQQTLQQWRQGILLGDRPTLPAEVEVMDRTSPNKTLLQIRLWEGRNRQIRRAAEKLGHPVLQLHRTAIGPIQLDCPQQAALSCGQFRLLTPEEVSSLKSKIDLISERMPVECKEQRR